MTDAHPNTTRVVDAARAHGLEVEVRRFPEGTRTAQDAAAAIGCDVGAIVKSLVLAGDGSPLVVLTSGRNRLDFGKVATALGVSEVRRADAATARAATGYPIGGTPPLGHATSLPVLLDETLLDFEEVWAAAGTPDTVFAVRPDDLLAATGARPADVAEGPPGP